MIATGAAGKCPRDELQAHEGSGAMVQKLIDKADVLVEALPYVQRSALSSEGRDDVPGKRSFFSDLRDEDRKSVV